MARDVRRGLTTSRRSSRRSTSTTSAARSSSSRSPSCPSTTRPAPSARSSPSARPRSSPRPARPATLVELGSGSAAKTRHLLDAMRDAGCLRDLRPGRHLRGDHPRDRRAAGRRVPGPRRPRPRLRLRARPRADPGRRRRPADRLPRRHDRQPLPRPAPRLPGRIAALLGPGDQLPARHRPGQGPGPPRGRLRRLRGVTAEFNKNVLEVLNRELGADFDLDAFEHVARYDARRGADGHPPALARRPAGAPRRRSTSRSSSPRARRCGPRSRPSSPASASRRSTPEAGLELCGWFTDPAGDYALSLAPRDRPASSLGRQRLDQLAELVGRRDRGEDRQRDAALDEGRRAAPSSPPASRR